MANRFTFLGGFCFASVLLFLAGLSLQQSATSTSAVSIEIFNPYASSDQLVFVRDTDTGIDDQREWMTISLPNAPDDAVAVILNVTGHARGLSEDDRSSVGLKVREPGTKEPINSTFTINATSDEVTDLEQTTVFVPVGSSKEIELTYSVLTTGSTNDSYQIRVFVQGYLTDESSGTSKAEESTVPGKATLGQNYPNPFNPTTTIEYSVDTPSSVRLNIYNTTGQLVKTIDQGQQAPGEYRVQWNGDNASGQTVASGTYFYQLEVDGQREAKKMVLVK